MARTIENYSTTQVLETTTQLDLLELEPDLFVFRREVSSKSTSNGKKGGLRASHLDAPKGRTSGYVNAAGRKQLLEGKAVSKGNQRDLLWLSREELELFRTRGYPDAMDVLWKGRLAATPDPWTDWSANPERDLDGLVFVDHSSHLLYDRRGTHVLQKTYCSTSAPPPRALPRRRRRGGWRNMDPTASSVWAEIRRFSCSGDK